MVISAFITARPYRAFTASLHLMEKTNCAANRRLLEVRQSPDDANQNPSTKEYDNENVAFYIPSRVPRRVGLRGTAQPTQAVRREPHDYDERWRRESRACGRGQSRPRHRLRDAKTEAPGLSFLPRTARWKASSVAPSALRDGSRPRCWGRPRHWNSKALPKVVAASSSKSQGCGSNPGHPYTEASQWPTCAASLQLGKLGSC